MKTRTEALVGKFAMDLIKDKKVFIFGIGGVGGYVVEALARSGVGTLDIIDNDIVSLSNLNRQIIATHPVIGRPKVEVAKERILSINPEAVVNAYQIFYLPDTPSPLNFKDYDYVVDAIDTVTGKIGLVMEAQKAGVPVISSMGTGNKLDPSALRVADIYQTSVCPLARVMRRELKKRGVESLKVVYSKETPVEPYSNSPAFAGMPASERNAVPGSTAFVPAAAGLILAGQVVRDLTGM